MMIMRWEGVTLEQNEQAKEVVGWKQSPPEGGVLHVTAHDGKALRITDVWQSAETFQAFVNDGLMPGVSAVGIEGEPEVEVLPLHDQFTPRPVMRASPGIAEAMARYWAEMSAGNADAAEDLISPNDRCRCRRNRAGRGDATGLRHGARRSDDSRRAATVS